MDPHRNYNASITRRQFFSRCEGGIGGAALASLLGPRTAEARAAAGPHHTPRAKRVIYLFQNGTPSHVDLFDRKPMLKKWRGRQIPDEIVGGRRFSTMTSVPMLTDFSDEAQHVLDLHGPDVLRRGSCAFNCLMARRLVERGVRFIQIMHAGRDQHRNLNTQLKIQCTDTDAPSAALVEDLRQRGMLDDTLVIWGGEFGRTPFLQGRVEDHATWDGITTPTHSPSGWPAAESSRDSPTANPTSSASTSYATKSTCTIFRPPCCTCRDSTTKG